MGFHGTGGWVTNSDLSHVFSHSTNIKHPLYGPNGMWKSPTKLWFLFFFFNIRGKGLGIRPWVCHGVSMPRKIGYVSLRKWWNNDYNKLWDGLGYSIRFRARTCWDQRLPLKSRLFQHVSTKTININLHSTFNHIFQLFQPWFSKTPWLAYFQLLFSFPTDIIAELEGIFTGVPYLFRKSQKSAEFSSEVSRGAVR